MHAVHEGGRDILYMLCMKGGMLCILCMVCGCILYLRCMGERGSILYMLRHAVHEGTSCK